VDALQWILEHKGVPRILHYLDNFLLFGVPGGSEGIRIINKAMELCKKLGVPIADHKTNDPTLVLTFLGIEVDAIKMEIHLPPAKLHQLKAEIRGESPVQSMSCCPSSAHSSMLAVWCSQAGHSYDV